MPGCAFPSDCSRSITKTCPRSGSPSTMPRTTAQRFASQKRTLAPESPSANSSSSAFHHALRGTKAAGIDAEVEQRPRDLADEHVVLAVREPAVALHHPVDVTAGLRGLDQVAHRR